MTRVNIFVEDPGAANYVAELPDALGAANVDTRLIATGSASQYLAERGVAFAQAPNTVDGLLDGNPETIIVGTSENTSSLGLAVVPVARRRGIPTVGVVDAYANAAYRFRGTSDDALRFAPDKIIVPDDGTRDVFLSLGARHSAVVACGHPHYDVVLKARVDLETLDRAALRRRLFGTFADAPIILFVSEVSTGLNGDQFLRSADYTLEGRGRRNRRTEIVLEELLDAVAAVASQARVIVRLHPKNTPDDFGGLLAEAALTSRGGSPLETVFAADLVVGMTSMLLVEAALLRRPTLALLPRACEAEWLPTLGSGTTTLAMTREAVREYLGLWSQRRLPMPKPFVVAPRSLEAVRAQILETLKAREPDDAH